MRISDEIREWCKWCDEHSAARDELCKLADRIDAEMVELPKDADGEVIRVGDMVYPMNEQNAKVDRITFAHGKTFITCWTGDRKSTYQPSKLTHISPDNLERIADDIEKVKGTVFIGEKTLDGWADRIRKLAKEEVRDGD